MITTCTGQGVAHAGNSRPSQALATETRHASARSATRWAISFVGASTTKFVLRCDAPPSSGRTTIASNGAIAASTNIPIGTSIHALNPSVIFARDPNSERDSSRTRDSCRYIFSWENTDDSRWIRNRFLVG